MIKSSGTMEKREPTNAELFAEVRALRKEINANRIQPALMSIAEVAKYIGASKSSVNTKWKEWLAYGVNPVRLHKHGDWRFRKTEIDYMIENHWAVLKD